MRLSYDGIVFDLLELKAWQKDAIYTEDRTTFLYWHHQIHVTCILNVDATNAGDFPKLFQLRLDNDNNQGKPGAPKVKKAWQPAGPDQIPVNPKDADQIKEGKDAAENASREIEEKFKDLFPGLVPPKPRPLEPGEDPVKAQQERQQEAQRALEELRKRIEGDYKKTIDDTEGIYSGDSDKASRSKTNQDFKEAAERQRQEEVERLKKEKNKFGNDIIFGEENNKKTDDRLGPIDQMLKKMRGRVRVIPGPDLRRTVPATMVELRSRLKMPRRQLLVWLHTGPAGAPEFCLVSPLAANAGSDAAHGPICTVIRDIESTGEQTVVMELMFETWEAPPIRWKKEVLKKEESLTDKSKKDREIKAKQAAHEAFVKGMFDRLAAAVEELKAKDQFGKAAEVINQMAKATIDALTARKGIEKAIEVANDLAKKAGLEAIADNQKAVQEAAKEARDKLGPILDPENGNKDRVRFLVDTPALLSNRWQMSFAWDPESYLRIQSIQGEAIFRMDVLRLKGCSADQMRQYIWHPIPVGYRREPIGQDDVVESPGGETIKYRITDREVLLNMPGSAKNDMVHVEIEETFDHNGYAFQGLGGVANPILGGGGIQAAGGGHG